ncbi:MAG: type I glyceraldehyde-3-phosphate dehydrogenase [Phototrophicaceae bacterium]
MAINVGINGFGRIGRLVFRAIMQYYPEEMNIVAFNDLGNLQTMAHLLKHDSVHGRFNGDVVVENGALVVNGHTVKALSERDPAKLPWGELGVDIVIESTGIFRKRSDAAKHIDGGGAKKVLISAPAKDEDITIVLGVNEHAYDPANHHVVSNASCTTNCLAPAAKVLQDKFGIVSGLMTTIHSYTADQVLVDAPHEDLRRARTAGVNMIPTTTGAAKAVALVMPELKGKFDGIAIRVPTPNGSLVDAVIQVERETNTEEVLAAFREAAEGSLKGILRVSTDDEELVLADIVGDSHSSIIDSGFTQAMGKTVKLMTWYDNEWGYSCRTADLAKKMGDLL